MIAVQDEKTLHLPNDKCSGFAAIGVNVVIVVAYVEAIAIHRRVVLDQRNGQA